MTSRQSLSTKQRVEKHGGANSVIILVPPLSCGLAENAHGRAIGGHSIPSNSSLSSVAQPFLPSDGGRENRKALPGNSSAASSTIYHLIFWCNVKRAELVFYPH